MNSPNASRFLLDLAVHQRQNLLLGHQRVLASGDGREHDRDGVINEVSCCTLRIGFHRHPG